MTMTTFTVIKVPVYRDASDYTDGSISSDASVSSDGSVSSVFSDVSYHS